MIPPDETFDGTWPFEARYFEGSGFRHHYIDEGSPDTGETFVLLHGEPTWGYLWRTFVPRLAKLGRVIVPDHMGFGKSEIPQDRSYSAQEHSENLARLLLYLDVTDVTLVMHDWGGPTGGQFAYRQPDRIKRMVVIDSFVKPMMQPEQAPHQEPGSTPWMDFILSDAFEPVMSHLDVTILSVLKKIGVNRCDDDGPWVRAYASPFSTPADCRGAKQFPRNLLLPETWSYLLEGEAQPGATEALARKPALLIHGEDDPTVPWLGALMMFKAVWPTAPTVCVPGAAHFLPEDAPEVAIALIEQLVQSTPP
jgi:haloalkane dehalogenase